ncbi:MAG: hypothetical protein WCC84_04855, partial [Candidatus Cybelea sp.]
SLARSGANARLELETALLRFIMSAEEPSFESIASRVAALETRIGGAPSAPPARPSGDPAGVRAAPKTAPAKTAPAKAAPVKSAPLSVQQVRAAWQSIRGKVESERQSLSAPLSRAVIEAVESNAIVLKLPNSWSAETLREHAALIESAIADVLGVPLKLTLRVDGSANRAPVREEDGPDALFDYANEKIRG